MKKVVIALAAVLVCTLLTVGTGVYAQTSAKNRLVPVYGVERADNRCAISFDAAWGADKTRQIMDICDEYGVKATFFLVGFWVDKYPDVVREIHERGFEIGTHSDTHPHMSKLSHAEITSQLADSVKKIYDITQTPVRLFRPPFGDYNNTLITAASEQGLLTIQWSVDSLDWKGLSARQIAERIQRAKSGDIILCHNNGDHITEALPTVLQALKLKGLQVGTVGETVYFDNYTIDANGIQHPVASPKNVA